MREAAAVRIEAQAKAGEILRLMKERGERDSGQGGDRRSQLQAVTVIPGGLAVPATLADLGASKIESSRWQAVAAVAPEVRQDYVETVKEDGGEVTTAGLMRFELERREEERRKLAPKPS